MAVRHFFLVLLVVAIWAFNNVAIKWGLLELPPLFLTWMRFVVVAMILIPFCRITREQLPWLLVLAFTFGFMHFSLLFVGMRYTDAGTGAIVVQLGTPIAMLLAMVVLKEKLRLGNCWVSRFHSAGWWCSPVVRLFRPGGYCVSCCAAPPVGR